MDIISRTFTHNGDRYKCIFTDSQDRFYRLVSRMGLVAAQQGVDKVVITLKFIDTNQELVKDCNPEEFSTDVIDIFNPEHDPSAPKIQL